MINVRLLIAPTVSPSPHDPIWRLDNHHLILLLLKEIVFLALKMILYLLCIMCMDWTSRGTIVHFMTERRTCRVLFLIFVFYLFRKISSKDSFLFLVGISTMAEITISVEMKGKKQICPPSRWPLLMLYLIRKEKSTKLVLQILKYWMWHQAKQTFPTWLWALFTLPAVCDVFRLYLKCTFLCPVDCRLQEGSFHIMNMILW